MNLSLKNRVATSFIVANIVVLILSFTVYYYLANLSKEIEMISEHSHRVSIQTDEVRLSVISILKQQRKIFSERGADREDVERLIQQADTFYTQLQTLESMHKDQEIKASINKILNYVDSLKVILGKSSMFYRESSGISAITDLADKILEAFSEFQDLQYGRSEEQGRKMRRVINETKKHMMITLIIGFLGTIILSLVIPGKISLPFKKIRDAIRELQECNFDVSIFYNQDDEIGEIAREMNKMIHSLKTFEELRADRIVVENRKFDVLANLSKKPVLVADAQGKLIYMNNRLYSLLQVQSDDVIGKNMSETAVPESIIEAYELAIKRRSKIENAEIKMFSRTHEETLDENGNQVVKKDAEQEIIFAGYANVIPIRAKESSLDYYVMVLSTEIFA